MFKTKILLTLLLLNAINSIKDLKPENQKNPITTKLTKMKNSLRKSIRRNSKFYDNNNKGTDLNLMKLMKKVLILNLMK